jgi:hypothetical protein
MADSHQANAAIPRPDVMPVDREAWARELHLSNFINCYFQYRDLQRLDGIRTVLIVGPGQGLDTHVLKWRGYAVKTFDIDSTFAPDVIGSVHDLSMFGDASFDAVIASHVLEHMAVPYLDRALEELARVARFALVYLPVAGRHFQLRARMDIRGIDLSTVLDLFNFLHRPDGVTARYCQKQHFWEVGFRGFRVRDLKRRFSHSFRIIDAYRNTEWLPSYNFVLASSRHAR